MPPTTTAVPASRAPRARAAAAAVAAAAACLAAFAPAAGAQETETFDGQVKLKGAPVAMACFSGLIPCWEPSEGNSASLSVRFHRRFTSVSYVRLTLHFVGDLLDPDIGGLVTPEDLGEYVQVSTLGAEQGIQCCYPYPSPSLADVDAILSFRLGGLPSFEDGRQGVRIHMVLGSATLASVDASITGVPLRR